MSYISVKGPEKLELAFGLPKLKADGSNKNDFFLPDVLGSKKFAQNHGGYPRSDISVINEMTDINAAKAMIEGLNVLPTVDGFEDVNEAMLAHRSKYCQTYSEGASYVREQMDIRLSRLQREKAEKTEIEFKEQDKSVTDD